MTSVITRQKYNSLEEKMVDGVKCNHYEEMTRDGDGTMELNTISEGSSGSSIAEMNNNTNGKVLIIGPDVNINDNRQQMAETPDVKAPPGTVSATVMKKIKQIYMDEAPLHLSGLSLSGSGMELFVKLDENLDKALRQANNTMPAKRSKAWKKMTRAKKRKGYFGVTNKMPTNPSVKGPDVNGQRMRVDDDSTKEEEDNQGRQRPVDVLKKRIIQNDEFQVLGDLTTTKDVDRVAKQSKPSATERIRQLKVRPHSPPCYFPYGWNQTFQEQPAQTTGTPLQRNMIRGPVWNVGNGEIDVIRSQESRPSTSIVQANTAIDESAVYSFPIDYSMSPFPGGFKSNNLPLKRKISPPRWHTRKVGPDPEIYSSLYQDDNECAGNEFTRKERIRRIREGRVKRLAQKKTAIKIPVPSTSQEASLTKAENIDVSQTVSDTSNGQQPSVGPRFETELLTEQTMDAETLVKFTEYTQDLRKDLKQKYRDLSKLLKAFEDTVQRKNSVTEAVEEVDSETQVGRCSVM